MSKTVFGTYTGKPEDGIIEIPAPGIQPNSAIAVNGDYVAANSAYVLGVRTPAEGDVLQIMVEGSSGTMRINYIYKKSQAHIIIAQQQSKLQEHLHPDYMYYHTLR